MLVQKEDKIGEVVARNFRSAGIFESYGLDFCCGGKKSISTACNEKGIQTEKVLSELEKITEAGSRDLNFNSWSPAFLADYIVNNHHTYVLNAIPVIEQHLRKVVSKHGEKFTHMAEVEMLFLSLKEELLSHMSKEEQMLFPYIKELEKLRGNTQDLSFPPFGTVKNPIKVMIHEHENAGEMVNKISVLTNGYTPPSEACATFRVLYNELKDFERDLHIHIHLENNILFPKAAELEKTLFEKRKN